MALRRPRLKVAVNLAHATSIKRKAKPQPQVEIQPISGQEPEAEAVVNENNDVINETIASAVAFEVSTPCISEKDNDALEIDIGATETESKEVDKSVVGPKETKKASAETAQRDKALKPLSCAINETHAINTRIVKVKNEVDDAPFKCPASVGHSGAEGALQSDIEESVIQMDLQKSTYEYPMSPTKTQARQRIRPTPIFGQRRNSLVGVTGAPYPSLTEESTGPGPGSNGEISPTPPRRERHHSASLGQSSYVPSQPSQQYQQHQQFAQKQAIHAGACRVRTESSCSNFSETYSSKSRKVTEEYGHRSYARRDFATRFTNGVPDKSALKMFDLIYYNPVSNPMEQKPIAIIKHEASGQDASGKPSGSVSGEISSVEKKEPEEGPNTSMPVPQLKLNADGELIIDDQSLEIETTAEQEARKVLANSSLIVLDENTGMNGFYKRHKRTRDWPPGETIKFYRCLQIIGTDFSMMCKLFPNRTRRDMKLKFKKEERCNLALINKAIMYPKTFNIGELQEQLEEEERQREENERKWKEIEAKELKHIKKVHIKGSVAARALKHGDEIYENENVVKRKFGTSGTKLGDSPATNSSEPDQKHTAKRRNWTERPKRKRPTEHSSNALHAQSTPIKTETVDPNRHEKVRDAAMGNAADSRQLEQELDELLCSDTGCDAAQTQTEQCTDSNLLADVTIATAFNDMTETAEMVAKRSEGVSVEIPTDQVNENDIQAILSELAEGSLALVSTADPSGHNHTYHEIYMMNKDTGQLFEKPLDIPTEIIESILTLTN